VENSNPGPRILRALVVAEVTACQRAGHLTARHVAAAVQAAMTRSGFTADLAWIAEVIASAMQYARTLAAEFSNQPAWPRTRARRRG